MSTQDKARYVGIAYAGIAYAYPTSDNARHLGRGNTGSWYVSYFTSDDPDVPSIPIRTQDAADSKDAAITMAEASGLPKHPWWAGF